jgi:adenylate kinase family enzyme
MIVAVVGNPFAGKSTLSASLAKLTSMRVVEASDLPAVIRSSATGAALRAQSLIEAGAQLPDELVGTLLAELVGGHDTILVGRPRSLVELEAFESASQCTPLFIHLEASPALVAARMTAQGLPSPEHDHPGALERLRVGLAPVLRRASVSATLLSLDASLPVEQLVGPAREFIDARRHDG